MQMRPLKTLQIAPIFPSLDEIVKGKMGLELCKLHFLRDLQVVAMDFMDFETRRKEMVRVQLRGRDITDRQVLMAMEKVPRHLFMPVEMWNKAYDDAPAPIGEAQTISQPYMVACKIGR